MEVATRASGDSLVVVISGELAGPQTVSINKIVERAREQPWRTVVLDLSNVSLLDSVGLGGLVYCHQVLQKSGKTLTLCAVPQHIGDMLDNLGFNRLFHIVDTVPGDG